MPKAADRLTDPILSVTPTYCLQDIAEKRLVVFHMRQNLSEVVSYCNV